SDNDHLRPMRLLQAVSERGSDASGGEILTFNVDVTPRGGDGVEIEGLDLSHFRTAGIGRLSTGNDHINVRDIGLHRARPRVSVDWCGRDALPGPAKPALTREFRQGARRRTVHQKLHVMEGRVGHTTMIEASWMLGQVRWRIPAPDSEIQTAREGDGVVHDDDFLV